MVLYKVCGGSDTMKRLSLEVKLMEDDPPFGSWAEPDSDNLFIWQGFILGPPDTPYDGGKFNLKLVFTEAYPKQPPIVTI